MRKILIIFLVTVLLSSCNTKTELAEIKPVKDSLNYAYKAVYSSDITVPGNPRENGSDTVHPLIITELR